MDQETYDAHVARLKAGEMVMLHGRSALSVEQLHFAIRAGGGTVPGDPEPAENDEPHGTEKMLEEQQLDQLRDLAASLGLTPAEEDTKESLIPQIRAVQDDLKNKA